MLTIKQAIKLLSIRQGYTQSELAEKMGIFQASLSRTINKPDHKIKADLLPIVQALGGSLELRFKDVTGETVAVVSYPEEGKKDQE